MEHRFPCLRDPAEGALAGRYYYIHAVDYDHGGEWAGNVFMCTDDESFTIRDPTDCEKRGHKRNGFFEVDTGNERDWTVRLVDQGVHSSHAGATGGRSVSTGADDEIEELGLEDLGDLESLD